MSKLNYIIAGAVVTVQLTEEIKDENGEVVSVNVLDSQDFDAEPVAFTPLESNQEPRTLAAYGLSKFLQDRTSQYNKEGAEKKFAAMGDVIKLIESGKWKEYKEGTSAAGGKFLAQAIANLKGLEIDVVREKLAAMDDEQRKDIGANPAVKAEVARLRALELADKVEDADLDF